MLLHRHCNVPNAELSLSVLRYLLIKDLVPSSPILHVMAHCRPKYYFTDFVYTYSNYSIQINSNCY